MQILKLSALALAALIATAAAQSKGFNYGSTNDDGSVRDQGQFQALFTTAQGLVGAPGFLSARLYTTIQAGTTNTPISAIPAAISTQTTLLLGLWASAGQGNIDNEIAALNAAISQYGSSFTDLIVGVSVGSEDLYRVSPTGIGNESGAGANPADVVAYINQVRAALSAAGISKPIGHVDTWTAWVNGSNSAVITASDFLGMDAYPYYQVRL
jgi:glucan endo-1,3-beta-D-glucosidase